MGPCVSCGVIFAFNPVRVPSVPVNGEREPACRACVDRANPIRVAKGLAQIVVHEDAYTGCREEEIR
jgi:hypothetical protein